MAEHALELGALLWAAGWLLAVIVLFVAGLRLPLETRLGGVSAWLYAAACVAAGLGVWVLANVALVLNDTHIDLTREKIYTPSADAMAVVDELRTPVSITYFYRSEDPVGRRAGEILEVMGRRNPLLTVTNRRSRQAAGARPPRGYPPLQRCHHRGRRPAGPDPGHGRGGDCHRHPARIAHARP